MTNSPNFVDAVNSAEIQQTVYRQILRAFSYPGCVQDLPTANANALSLVLATLVDDGVRWADPDGLVPTDLLPLLGPLSDPETADFIVSRGWQAPTTPFQPRLGGLHHPHEGATLILQCERLGEGPCEMRITGPGVQVETSCPVTGLETHWLLARKKWVSRFPLGVDILLCDTHRVVGLPRTSVIAFAGDR